MVSDKPLPIRGIGAALLALNFAITSALVKAGFDVGDDERLSELAGLAIIGGDAARLLLFDDDDDNTSGEPFTPSVFFLRGD
jgi:hypothetical protein